MSYFCFFVSGCVFVSRCVCLSVPLSLSLYLSLWPSLLSLSTSLCRSLLLHSSSFLILFISRRDGPQRRSVELSDLNKCLRLEPGLSCGLGCLRGRRCSSHSIVPQRLNEPLSKPPPLPPSAVCHSRFVASIFNDLEDVRKAPASVSVWTNKIVEAGHCFLITAAITLTQIQRENCWDIGQFA